MRSPDLSSRTPTLAETIRLSIDSVLVEVRTGFPGIVVSYDATKQVADIQPALKTSYYDGSIVNLPILPDVPVMFPASKKFHIHWKLEAGDLVWVQISDRSLDNFKANGKVVDPEDSRKFDLSDAVCYPASCSPAKAFVPYKPDYAEIVHDKIKVSLNPAGKIEIKNDTAELIDQIKELTSKVKEIADKLSTDTVNTLLGPQPLLNAPQYAVIKTAVQSIETKIESFKE